MAGPPLTLQRCAQPPNPTSSFHRRPRPSAISLTPPILASDYEPNWGPVIGCLSGMYVLPPTRHNPGPRPRAWVPQPNRHGKTMAKTVCSLQFTFGRTFGLFHSPLQTLHCSNACLPYSHRRGTQLSGRAGGGSWHPLVCVCTSVTRRCTSKLTLNQRALLHNHPIQPCGIPGRRLWPHPATVH